MGKMPIGLVLQGGGALGAYEYGAVKCLLDLDYDPVVISGVSIGAINTACLAGARHGDKASSLDAMWTALTMPENPFVPFDKQALLSLFGNPAFWAMRKDWTTAQSWTNYYDVQPMYDTLNRIIDFDRINAPEPAVRMAVTATDVQTGGNARFSNYDPNRKKTEMFEALQIGKLFADNDSGMAAERSAPPPVGTIKNRVWIEAKHIMASGALPPAFPSVSIDGKSYWDGGLFDNTPLRPLVEMLKPEEATSLPIFVINLFPNFAKAPANLNEVTSRMMAIQYESRFTDETGSYDGLIDYGNMLDELMKTAEEHQDVFRSLLLKPQFQRQLLYRAVKNVRIIPALEEFTQIGPQDFSPYSIEKRKTAGYQAVETYFKREGQDVLRADRSAAPSAA